MKNSIWRLKKLSLVLSCLLISVLSVQSQPKNKDADQTGFFYTDKLSWSGATKEIILSGKTSVVFGKNKFKGKGSFSILGKASLLIVDGKQFTPDSSVNTSGKKCRIVRLPKDEVIKKYGLAGGPSVVEIAVL